MPNPTIRVPEQTKRTLRELAQKTNSTVQEVLELAVDNLRRQVLMDVANNSYRSLQTKSELHQRRDQERAARSVLEQDRLQRLQRQRATGHHAAHNVESADAHQLELS